MGAYSVADPVTLLIQACSRISSSTGRICNHPSPLASHSLHIRHGMAGTRLGRARGCAATQKPQCKLAAERWPSGAWWVNGIPFVFVYHHHLYVDGCVDRMWVSRFCGIGFVVMGLEAHDWGFQCGPALRSDHGLGLGSGVRAPCFVENWPLGLSLLWLLLVECC